MRNDVISKMKLRNYRLFLLMLCTLIRYTQMQMTSSIAGELHKGQAINGVKMKTYFKMGLKMCAKTCYRSTSCGAFSHHLKSLTCQLYVENSTSLTPDPEHTSGNLSEWDGFDGHCVKSPCPDKNQNCYEGKDKRFCMYNGCTSYPTTTARFMYLETAGKTRKIDDTLEFKCQPSFIARGNTKVVCQPNQEYSDPDPNMKCYRVVDDFVLAARFTPGIGTSVYQTWLSTTNSDDDKNVGDQCFNVQTSNLCTNHYLSGLVGEWSTLDIFEVRLALYTAGIEVAHILFNGDGTSKTTWFQASNIISSSWNDVTQSIASNLFSMKGLESPALRRFYISSFLGVCTQDEGWFCAIEATGLCPYDKRGGYPYFIYSQKATKALLQTEFLTADVMAILLKIKNFP